ncbi:MAG: Adenylate/guanylate cyclase (modular protein) [Chloroflexi bacterium]|nr:Adenylate/guanylate cyclase (modular protein) [Chloroflexota bacterium]
MLEVSFLGQFEVLHDGTRLTIPTRNAQALFAYLLINAGKMHRREQLAGLLWPDSSEENARSNLRHELWRLRKVFESVGEPIFDIDDLAIAFHPRGEFFFDVHKIESPLKENSTIGDLITALSVYRGELLPGFYEEWIFVERNRLQALFEAKMTRLLDMLQREGRWPEVLEWGMRWITVEQWSEPAYRALITAYANYGDLSKAAATYERFSHGLQKDLGVKPSEQTQALYKRLKSGWKMDVQQKEVSTVEFPSKANGNDKRTSYPTSAQDNTFPTFTLAGLRRSNLPRPLTSFIGREKEIQQVERLLARARLITIIGPGGVGKTRMAIQAAGTLLPLFQDGAWWVELASVFETRHPDIRSQYVETDLSQDSPHEFVGKADQARAGMTFLPSTGHAGVELIAQAVAKVLRIPETPGLSPLENILEHLADKELLLVLDNCEHLIESCAALAERVLDGCPNVVILATSREALQLPGEIAWLLPSLSLPGRGSSGDFSNLRQSEAVNLFIERASDVLPGYQPGETEMYTIGKVCWRLDGIPLAVELAAARIKMLSVQEIEARLDSRFSLLTGGLRTALPRHQTLLNAIEWSYDLLNQPEQTLFRRLSIFATSFALEAAESVCGSREIHKDEVLTVLGRLVNKSLLQVEPAPDGLDLATRYRFLDTICSFARLKLEEAGETNWMRDQHAEYYINLVKAAEPELLTQKAVHWHNILRAENDNLRAVFEWSFESDQPDNALQISGALMWFWWRSGMSREGRDLTLKTLALPSAVQFEHTYAKALNTASLLLTLSGDTPSARRSLEEALSILRRSSDEASLAWSLQLLGLVLTTEREYDLADAAFQEGLAITRKLVDQGSKSFLFFYGDLDLQKGDHIRAKKRYLESVSILRTFENASFLAYPLRRLGYLALAQTDIAEAREYFLESLKLNRETGDIPGVIASLVSFAVLAVYLEKPIPAAQLCAFVENRLDSLSVDLLSPDQIELIQIHNKLLTSLDQATFTSAFSEGWELSEEQAIVLVGEIS